MKRRLAILCIRVGGILALGFLVLGAYYALSRPDNADPSSGRIYRIGYRGGSAAYLTKSEVWWLCALGGGAIPFVVIGSALGWPFPKNDYDKVRATYRKDPDSQ
jgi:hypothetical protein